MEKKYLKVFMFCLPLLIGYSVFAQKKVDTHDTIYYKNYPHSLTLRFYFSQKYAILNFKPLDNSKNLEYRANTKVNMGLGFTYNNFTLNGALGFGFINNKYNERNQYNESGKTKSLDLQLHLYPNGWAGDLTVTSYKGFYAYPQGYAVDNPNFYYFRPDLKFNLFGLTAYRVSNSKRFSYRAAMVQNEWQKRSAGSLLYGGGIYYSSFKGDSSIVPPKVTSSFAQTGVDNFHFISVGPGIGYAYTAVAAQHFFIMGSLIANANIYFLTDENNNNNSSTKTNKVNFEPVAIVKAAAGYNGNVWDVSINWAGNAFLTKDPLASKTGYLSTGNFRINLAKKIMLKKKSKSVQ